MLDANKKIAILGFGIEGQSIANYLRKHGVTDITVCDKNESIEVKNFKLKTGADYLDNLTDSDVVFRSPGIPFKTSEIQTALKNHVEVTSAIKFFFQKCPCPIIGITGTKGKGTTATLIYEILKKAGRDAYLGGNIGNSPLDFLDDLKENSIVVLELGHGQIEDLEQGPDIGIILGVTEDHLDYHPDIETYRSSKHPLIAVQTGSQKAIINTDYEGNQPFFSIGSSKKYRISTKHAVRHGAYLYKKNLILKTGLLAKKLMSTSDIALLGKHNIENVLPASLAAKLLGVPDEHIIKTVRTFKGLPHRLELVAEKNGIKFINDSFSTTPLTSIAAMRAFETPIILIAGGSEKHADFKEWAQVAAERDNLKEILLIGETGPHMLAALEATGTKKGRLVDDFDGAFKVVRAEAKSGDVVVLSPACASFGLFHDYKERGKKFGEMATKI